MHPQGRKPKITFFGFSRCAARGRPGRQNAFLPQQTIWVQERWGAGGGKRLLAHTSHPAFLAGIRGNFAKTGFTQNFAARLAAVRAAKTPFYLNRQYGFRKGGGPGEENAF